MGGGEGFRRGWDKAVRTAGQGHEGQGLRGGDSRGDSWEPAALGTRSGSTTHKVLYLQVVVSQKVGPHCLHPRGRPAGRRAGHSAAARSCPPPALFWPVLLDVLPIRCPLKPHLASRK